MAEDDRPGAAPVVILGHLVWRNRYQSDPGILGRSIRVNGVPSVVIGVMPEGMKFPMRAELWQPLNVSPTQDRERRDARSLTAFGRLKAGTSIDQGREDLARVMADLAREHPTTNADTMPVVRTYSERAVGTEIRLVFLALMGAVVFVLLIACANVANLVLARAAHRSREVSVRLAMAPVLLTGAGLLVRSFIAMFQLDGHRDNRSGSHAARFDGAEVRHAGTAGAVLRPTRRAAGRAMRLDPVTSLRQE